MLFAAHLHHAYESYIKGGRTKESLKRSLLVSSLQFAYTCVFGWYANFLFLRSGSILPPLVAHVYCNIMGLPNPIEASKQYPKRKWRKCVKGRTSRMSHLLPPTLLPSLSDSHLCDSRSRRRWLCFAAGPTNEPWVVWRLLVLERGIETSPLALYLYSYTVSMITCYCTVVLSLFAGGLQCVILTSFAMQV